MFHVIKSWSYTKLLTKFFSQLGVLFLPSPVKTQGCNFSCTGNNSMKVKWSKIPKPVNQDPNDLFSQLCYVQAKQETRDEVEKRSKLVTMTWQGDRDSPEIISLPVPYQLPPKPYSSEGFLAFILQLRSFLSFVGFLTFLLALLLFSFRCSMVMGPRVLEEGCVWTSLA